MAAAVVRSEPAVGGLRSDETKELVHVVVWNGRVIARCEILADANAVAAAHPA